MRFGYKVRSVEKEAFRNEINSRLRTNLAGESIKYRVYLERFHVKQNRQTLKKGFPLIDTRNHKKSGPKIFKYQH